MGLLTSVGSLAGIVGIGALTLTSGLMQDVSLRWYYIIGGAIIVISTLFFWRLSPKLGATHLKQPRMVVKKRYWRFYTLKFFEGSRKEILGSFCTLVLVDYFGWQVWQTSSLLMARVSSFASCWRPTWVHSWIALAAGTLSWQATRVLLIGAIVYATVPSAPILAATYLVLRLGVILNLGLNVYVHEQAPPEELNPTLAAGVSFDHISSVAMPFIYGALMPLIGYSGVYWFAASIIFVSVLFVARLLPRAVSEAGPVLAGAD